MKIVVMIALLSSLFLSINTQLMVAAQAKQHSTETAVSHHQGPDQALFKYTLTNAENHKKLLSFLATVSWCMVPLCLLNGAVLPGIGFVVAALKLNAMEDEQVHYLIQLNRQ